MKTCCKCFKCVTDFEYRTFNGLCDLCYYDQYHTKEKDYSIKSDEIIRDYYRNEFDKEINK